LILGELAILASAQESVLITPWVQKAVYCRQRDGASVFQLFVGLSFANVGSRPVIIPRFAAVSRYRVEDESGREVLRSPTLFMEMDSVSKKLWAAPRPDPTNFTVVPPGQASHAGVRFEVFPVVSIETRGRGLSRSRQYLVYLQLDHGPRHPENRAIPSEQWSEIGRWITGKIEATPVRIQIPGGSPTDACSEPPTITISRGS
jgi:hypothetical protein